MQKQGQIGRAILGGAVFGVICVLMFGAGFVVRGTLDNDVSVRASEGGYPLLFRVQSILNDHYLYEQPEAVQREYGAIRGMLGTLEDRYTFFIDPPVAANESDALAGTYGGVGVKLMRSAAGDLLMYPFPDSPAEAAGVLADDILIAIGEDLLSESGLSFDAIERALRGEVREGSGVTITARRLTGEDYTVFIAFGVINVPSVIWRMVDDTIGIGYVQITSMTARTPTELNTAAVELQQAGLRALIVDLRGNAGGLLDDSIAVADAFIDGGVIAHQVTPTTDETLNGTPGGAFINIPLAVLIDRGTASGAEIVAGALRDYDRATLIGTTTFGKGTVQQIFPLPDRSSLHVTSREWFTPSRAVIDAVGIPPMIELDPAIGVDGVDRAQQHAVEMLREQLTESEPTS